MKITRDSWWIKRSGEWLKIKQMDDAHVYNSIAYTLGRWIIDVCYGKPVAWISHYNTIRLLVREYNGRMSGKLKQQVVSFTPAKDREDIYKNIAEKTRRKK